jgi:hypothetical protein
MNGIAQHIYDHRISDALRQGVRSPLKSLIKSRRGITMLVVAVDLLAIVASFLLLWVMAVMATDKALPMTPPGARADAHRHLLDGDVLVHRRLFGDP